VSCDHIKEALLKKELFSPIKYGTFGKDRRFLISLGRITSKNVNVVSALFKELKTEFLYCSILDYMAYEVSDSLEIIVTLIDLNWIDPVVINYNLAFDDEFLSKKCALSEIFQSAGMTEKTITELYGIQFKNEPKPPFELDDFPMRKSYNHLDKSKERTQ